MSQDIDNMLGNCETCLKFQYKQRKETLKQSDAEIGPWDQIGTDLVESKNKYYLLVIDYYSNFPEVCPLSSTSSEAVIKQLKVIFSRYGIPRIIWSDNGPQYDCVKFRQFAKLWGFQHVTSSPTYPQSNGKAEKGVQIVKRLIEKAKDSGRDAPLALLMYRVAPLIEGKVQKCKNTAFWHHF